MTTKANDCPRRASLVLVAALAAALLVPALLGCRSTDRSPPARYVLAATLNGYKIQAVSDRPATIVERGDHVLIGFADHRIRVERGRVVLDDNETAAFPLTAAQIVIAALDGTLRVTADGQEMWKRPFLW